MKLNQILEMAADSAGTSISQVAAGLRKLKILANIKDGAVNLDWGGGKYDKGSDYLRSQGITNLVHDDFNREKDFNKKSIKRAKENGGADSGTLLNVLNVIKDKDERIKAVKTPLKYLKAGAKLIIGAYNRNNSKEPLETSKGWQMNQPLSFYKKELEDAGLEVKRKDGFLIITK